MSPASAMPSQALLLQGGEPGRGAVGRPGDPPARLLLRRTNSVPRQQHPRWGRAWGPRGWVGVSHCWQGDARLASTTITPSWGRNRVCVGQELASPPSFSPQTFQTDQARQAPPENPDERGEQGRRRGGAFKQWALPARLPSVKLKEMRAYQLSILLQGLITCCFPGAWRCPDESGEVIQKPSPTCRPAGAARPGDHREAQAVGPAAVQRKLSSRTEP